jgi:hypothetical protein
MRRFRIGRFIKWQIELPNALFQFALNHNANREWNEKMKEGIVSQAEGGILMLKNEMKDEGGMEGYEDNGDENNYD